VKFGDVENFAELMENMKLNLSAYQPSYYTVSKEERKRLAMEKENRKKKGVKGEKGAVLKDEIQREHFLVKMMMILMLKRLESSWASFYITVERIYDHHSNALNKITEYEKTKKDIDLANDEETINSLGEEDETGVLDGFILGKKSPIQLKAIDDAGNLESFKKAIKEDKKTLKYILDNVLEFKIETQDEKGITSYDTKLEELLKIIKNKQEGQYQKIVIFSAYKDTVQYLFNQLKNRGFNNFAMVSGDENKVWNEAKSSKKHETILQRFAPYTKLFREKNWPGFKLTSKDLLPDDSYNEWKFWIKENHPETLSIIDNKIDILLATDVLSEGQNLQDADMVINYDIHWNPVRVIQRVGRIDRIGSPYDKIQVINFWPAKDLDDYINLKNRVEKRMAAMKVTGSEVLDEFTEEFYEMAEADTLEAQQNANMLRQMENSVDDIDKQEAIGLDDFSFDNYRQQLLSMLSPIKKEFEDMPNGVFSGVKIENTTEVRSGIIALMGYPAKKKFNPKVRYLSYELIYIDESGNQISNNQKIILEELNNLYQLPRHVEMAIDCGDSEAIGKLSNAIRKWIDCQCKNEIEMEDGSKKEMISNASLNIIDSLKSNPKKTILKLKTEGSVSEKYQFNNFDLITWFILS
jgi:superfamily II DNA or RNA helicase